MRFERQRPIFGEEGQQRIMSSVVGVIGCGGLGVNLITQLTVAGVSHFILCDPGYPEPTDLNRQFIYSAGDMRPKAVISAEWILALNPTADLQANSEPLSADNHDLFSGCDIIVDCLNGGSSDLIANLVDIKKIPLVSLRTNGMRGEVSVISPNNVSKLTGIDECEENHRLGAAVSAVASMGATEVLKIISGIGTENMDKTLYVDLEDWSFEADAL